MTMPIKTNNGTAISWSFNIVEFVPSVINKVEKKKLYPQMPKMKAKKISVNAIGNPIKITNNIAPIMIRPIVGLSSDGLAFIISVNPAPPGTKSGKKIANTSQVSNTR